MAFRLPGNGLTKWILVFSAIAGMLGGAASLLTREIVWRNFLKTELSVDKVNDWKLWRINVDKRNEQTDKQIELLIALQCGNLKRDGIRSVECDRFIKQQP